MKSAMEQEQIQKKHESNRRFWIVWSFAAAIVVVVMGFYGLKSWRLEKENQRFEVSIENTQKRLQALAPGTESLVKRQKEVARNAEKFRTNWSNIMEQIVDLESSAVRFSRVNFSEGKMSVSCQATSWKSLSVFIDSLKKDSRVSNIRIASTSILSPPVAGAKQSAELTFNFFPNHNEDK